MAIDDTTKTEIDGETAQSAEDKTAAEYQAKPACDACGHHPGDALHECKPAVRIEAPEVEEMTPATLGDFLEIVDKHGSVLMTPGDRIRYAKMMLARHPFIDRAYRAGLRQGRDLRERAKRGIGWEWAELADLTPRERTFVLGRVRDEVMGRH